MDDEKRIKCIIDLLEKNRNVELIVFYKFIRNTNSKLDNILINDSKEVFLETFKKARDYHYKKGDFKNRNPEIGLDMDMLYRLCNDAHNDFTITNNENVLDFTKIFRKRIEKYIELAYK